MSTPDETTTPGLAALVRAEWPAFRSRGRMAALLVAALAVIALAVLPALGSRGSCSKGPVEVPCPTDPLGPDGRPVSDLFFFAHRPLTGDGSLTVRLTALTGTITYPPPDHDEIVAGVVPWAKTGIIIKDGLGQGSSYAALLMTGSHGVRFQHDYTHDTAGLPGGVSPQSPRWLRLTRTGDTITGEESADGTSWTPVGTARLAGLPATAQIGLFAASPGDLTLAPVGLGGSVGQVRFTQAVGSFDSVTTTGGVAAGPWSADTVGELGHTDWEKFHRAPGLVEEGGTLTVTGSGDIGPVGTEGGRTSKDTLVGLFVAVLILIVTAARYAARAVTGATPGGRRLAARALVLGGAVFVSGLAAVAVAVPLGTMLLRDGGLTVVSAGPLTELRVVVGTAVLLALVAVLALALGALLRRAWLAVTVLLAGLVLPYLLVVVPLLPDAVADWLLRLTPAAGFAVLQTLTEYPQVTMHYAPYAGYFPLPWWAGLAVTGAFAALALGLALRRAPRRPETTPVDWR
ncbi:hypothetical protein [Catellatospora coxensis]|uniref:ABC-type transport system involved in multi-copper enzyme maturation permease subunit n=1 Tax=Catellatospora coxensis TaxID=310354 RepID=A0A8J3P6X3_9ACTN|nr:hypothetical protein [Catellatospora coxensis]GIG05972.1 hypothetical protein Cco03nite_26720 [Catellatospora coxensis]